MTEPNIDPIARALLDEIDAFCERHSITPTAFGLASVNDGRLVGKLRAGNRPITSDRMSRIKTFMENYRPPLGRKRRAEHRSAA